MDQKSGRQSDVEAQEDVAHLMVVHSSDVCDVEIVDDLLDSRSVDCDVDVGVQLGLLHHCHLDVVSSCIIDVGC